MREIIVLKLSILLGLVLLKVHPSVCGFSPVGQPLKVRAVRELMKGFTLISPSGALVLDVSQYAVDEIARTRKSGHLIRLVRLHRRAAKIKSITEAYRPTSWLVMKFYN